MRNMAKSLAYRYPKKIMLALPPALTSYWFKPAVCEYKRIASIMPNGDVTICSSFGFNGLIAGNVKRASFRELYSNGDIFLKIRELTHEDFGGVCSKCIFAPYCANNCLAHALDHYGTYKAPNPTCQMMYEAGLFPKEFLK